MFSSQNTMKARANSEAPSSNNQLLEHRSSPGEFARLQSIDVLPRPPKRTQGSPIRKPQKSSTIPSTPDDHAPCSVHQSKFRGKEREDSVPDTPRQLPDGKKLRAIARTSSSDEPTTPKRSLNQVKGDSPFCAIDLSSASESSDCEVQEVSPSSRKKQSTNTTGPTHSEALARQFNSRRVSSGINAPKDSQRRPLISKAASSGASPALYSSTDCPSEREDSDCIIERVVPSPRKKRRRHPMRLLRDKSTPNTKTFRRNSSLVSTGKGTALSGRKSTTTPRMNGAAIRIEHDECDADAEDSEAEELPSKPRAWCGSRTFELPEHPAIVLSNKVQPSTNLIHTTGRMDLTGEPLSIDLDIFEDKLLTHHKALSNGQNKLESRMVRLPTVSKCDNAQLGELLQLPSHRHQQQTTRGENDDDPFAREASPSPSSIDQSSARSSAAPEVLSSQDKRNNKTESISDDPIYIKLEHMSNNDCGAQNEQGNLDENNERLLAPPSYQQPLVESSPEKMLYGCKRQITHCTNSDADHDYSSSTAHKQLFKTPDSKHIPKHTHSTGGVHNRNSPSSETPVTPSPYKLNPAYSGDSLLTYHKSDTPGSHQPRHRNFLIGLRGILKTPRKWPLHEVKSMGQLNGALVSSQQVVEEPDERIISSPIERAQHGKMKAHIHTSYPLCSDSEDNEAILKHEGNDTMKGSILLSNIDIEKDRETKTRPIKQVLPYRNDMKLIGGEFPFFHSIYMSILTLGTDENVNRNLPAPVKSSQRRSSKKGHKRTLTNPDVSDHQDHKRIRFPIKKHNSTQTLKPIPTSEPWIPQKQDFKPALIRDGVSEHAIQPTINLLKQRIEREEALPTRSPTGASLAGSRWTSTWAPPPTRSRYRARAMAAELRHRGIKTDIQYGNFWYNLTMAYSRLAGSPIPLFTMNKMAFEDFEAECMKIRRDLQSEPAEEKETKPQGLDALLLWGAGETDVESTSTGSSDGEDLVVRIKDNMARRKQDGR